MVLGNKSSLGPEWTGRNWNTKLTSLIEFVSIALTAQFPYHFLYPRIFLCKLSMLSHFGKFNSLFLGSVCESIWPERNSVLQAFATLDS